MSEKKVAQDSPPALPGEVWRGSDGESPGTVAIAGDPAAPDMGLQAWWFDASRGRWRAQGPAFAAVIFRAWALSLRAERDRERTAREIALAAVSDANRAYGEELAHALGLEGGATWPTAATVRAALARAAEVEREALAGMCEAKAREVREAEFFGPREAAETLRGLAAEFRARGSK